MLNEKAREDAPAHFQDVHVVTSHSLARGRVWPMPLDVKSYPKEKLFHWSAVERLQRLMLARLLLTVTSLP